jgi:hypothetical protein
MHRAIWISGAEIQNKLFEAIRKMGLNAMYLSDVKISKFVEGCDQPRARYHLEESYPVILFYNKETNHNTIVFTCFQIKSSIPGPMDINRPQGQILIPIIR